MTTRAEFREMVVEALSAASLGWVTAGHAALTVEYQNWNSIDPALQELPYLCLEIEYFGAEQLDMSNKPLVGSYGQIHLAYGTKVNTGAKQAELVLEFFQAYLEMQPWPGTIINVAEPQKTKEVKGWTYFPVIINFRLQRLTTY